MLEIALAFYIVSSISYIVYFWDQKAIHHKSGFILLLAGFVCHLGSLAATVIHLGYMPVFSLREVLSFSSISVTAIFIIIRILLNIRIMGVLASCLSALVLGASMLVPGYQFASTGGSYNDFLLIIHVVTTFTGDAAFVMAAGAGFLYILQENAIKAKRKGIFLRRLPSLELLDSTGYSCLKLGFCFLTIGLAAGMAYAKITWGRFWGWDVKEIWSAATWFLYAAILHGRKASGWRGRHAAIMYMFGLAVALFTFLGVNFLMGGHHGDFTRFR